MPTPAEIEAMPRTPGSVVRASAAFDEHRVRVWELHTDGRWRDTYGNRRAAAQLRRVEILRVAPPADGKEVAA